MENKEIRKRHTGSATGSAIDGSGYNVVVESPQHHETLSSSTSERRLFESDEDVTAQSKIELTLSEPNPPEKPFKQYMLALLTLAIGNVRCLVHIVCTSCSTIAFWSTLLTMQSPNSHQIL